MISSELELFIASSHITLIEAMQKIDLNVNGILFLVNDGNKLCGAVSDGDIRRWILRTSNLDTEISKVMNRHPIYISDFEKGKALEYMEKKSVCVLPVTDGEKHVVDIVFAKRKKRKLQEVLKDVPVIIMAGGKGTRLYPYTKILPKPLIPIGDVPIMERIIDGFCEYGISKFYITVNYRRTMIQSYFADIDRTYEIIYVEEMEPLGTAGGIRLLKQKFDIPLFIMNCDIIIKADYSDMYQFHKNSGNVITVVAALKNDRIPYGVIYSKENGEIIKMDEKPCRSYFVNTGMYIINPEMIELIPRNTFFHMTDLTNRAMESGLKVGMYPISEDSFLDMGEFEEMERMEEKLNL